METVVVSSFAKSVIETGDIPLTISFDLGAGTKSLHTTQNVNYTVPVNRKFVMHNVFFSASDTSAGNITISQGTVVDTLGTTISDLRYAGNSSGSFSLYCDVTAGNLVTCQGSAGHMSIAITGIETDA